jgi:hypothetical protein
MPINKFAGWGVAPEDAPRPPGLGAILRVGLGALNTTIDKRLAAGAVSPAPLPRTPSRTALRVIWSLNAVRDALSDQEEPGLESTNGQLERRFFSKAVEQIQRFLEQFHEKLLIPYRAQFRPLDVDGDDFDDFDLERRKRMAEVAGFEWAVMAVVEDSPEAQGFEWVEVVIFEEPNEAPNRREGITTVADEARSGAAATRTPRRSTKQRR